jgi:hypothetical protein
MDKFSNHRPTGKLDCDMKNVGTKTGVTDTYGGNLNTGLKNSEGSGRITGATKSDAPNATNSINKRGK